MLLEARCSRFHTTKFYKTPIFEKDHHMSNTPHRFYSLRSAYLLTFSPLLFFAFCIFDVVLLFFFDLVVPPGLSFYCEVDDGEELITVPQEGCRG